MSSTFISTAVSALSSSIQVPGDKSISHRALIFGAIATGKTEIRGLLMGADNLATLEIMRALGVKIQSLGDGHFLISGVGLKGLKMPGKELDCGNSGTAMRLLTGLLSGQFFDSVLIGDPSLTQRPMARVVKPLEKMGAKITMSEKGTAPLKINGHQKLRGIRYEMPVASAQVKSCLLLAGLYAEGETEIIETGPSRDHTERMLRAFKADIQVDGNKIRLLPGNALIAANIDVPGDISSAAFFMVAATIVENSEIVLTKVGINPTRIGIITILNVMGADISLENEHVVGDEPVADIRIKSAKLHGIEIPVEQVPLAIDEFPIIFIAAACAKGKTILKGAHELRVKETDRILAMAKGLEILGISTEILEDGLIIEGGTFSGGTVESYDDHRIAMAFAIAGAVAKTPITIKNTENVATSFPNFIELAASVGCQVSSSRVSPRNLLE
jgi:3-phosphoshikimate 1-carboxyvinyltransferase